MLSHLAELLAIRELLAQAPCLPADPNARIAFEQAAACVFATCERLAAFAAAVGGRTNCN